MAYFNEFPVTRTYDSDLGWIIRKLKSLTEEIDGYIELNSIDFADPINWNITSQYPRLTIVLDNNGGAYISRQPVPSGVPLTNTDYWTEIYNTTNVVNSIRKNVAHDNGEIETATKDLLQGDLFWYNGDIYCASIDIPIGTRFVVGTNCYGFTVDEKINMIKELLKSGIDSNTSAISNLDTTVNEKINTINDTTIPNILNGVTPFKTVNLTDGTFKMDAPETYSDYFGRIPYTDANNDVHYLLTQGGDIESLGMGMYVNVLKYGADNTGTNDSTKEIQAAIDYAATLPRGGVVYFPSGVYRITNTLKSKSQVSFLGDSMRDSILQCDFASGVSVGIDFTSVDIRGQFVKDISVYRTTQDVPSGGYPIWLAQAGLLFGCLVTEYNSAIFTIENVFIQNFVVGISGCKYHGTSHAIGLFDSILKNVWVDSTASAAIALGGSGNVIIHPRITNCQNSGLLFVRISDESFDGVTVLGGIFISTNGYDIAFRDAGMYRNISFRGTWFEQSASGIVNMPFTVNGMNITMIGCMFNSNSTSYDMFTVTNLARGVMELFNCTFYATLSNANTNIAAPTTTSTVKVVARDCVKINSSGVWTIYDLNT